MPSADSFVYTKMGNFRAQLLNLERAVHMAPPCPPARSTTTEGLGLTSAYALRQRSDACADILEWLPTLTLLFLLVVKLLGLCVDGLPFGGLAIDRHEALAHAQGPH